MPNLVPFWFVRFLDFFSYPPSPEWVRRRIKERAEKLWIAKAREIGATRILVIRDAFRADEIAVFIKKGQSIEEVKKEVKAPTFSFSREIAVS